MFNKANDSSGVADKQERLTVNQKNEGAVPSSRAKHDDPNFAHCCCCKLNKPKDEFCRNKTKKNGRQTVCKNCAKTTYGKWLTCSQCQNKFYIKHRNIRKRRSSLCLDCIRNETIKRNKARAKDIIYTTKGYEYVRDFDERHTYILNHRKEMEKHLNRKLTKEEIVHHIDGDRQNNNINNLFLTTSSGHSKAHRSLELIGYKLIQLGQVIFDSEIGLYRLKLD